MDAVTPIDPSDYFSPLDLTIMDAVFGLHIPANDFVYSLFKRTVAMEWPVGKPPEGVIPTDGRLSVPIRWIIDEALTNGVGDSPSGWAFYEKAARCVIEVLVLKPVEIPEVA